jgi:hypothetical protein
MLVIDGAKEKMDHLTVRLRKGRRVLQLNTHTTQPLNLIFGNLNATNSRN